jgi:hypothetical protein
VVYDDESGEETTRQRSALGSDIWPSSDYKEGWPSGSQIVLSFARS